MAENLKQYLHMLEDSLREKAAVLDEILEANEGQAALCKAETLDMEAFDRFVDVKADCIDRLDKLDEGFTSLYDRIKERLDAEKASCKEEISRMQTLITKITDKSTRIQAGEKRNKEAMERLMLRERKKIQMQRTTSKAAMSYYESMNKLKVVPPQFLDNRK